MIRPIILEHEAEILRLLGELYTDEDSVTWMHSAQPLLGHEVPAKLIETEDGYHRVRNLLQAILDGAYL